MPLQAEFVIEEKEFAAGGFRKAFKATSITEGFNKGTWVVKSYLESAVQLIKDTGQTTEEHTRKSVQMQYLARNFASQLKETLQRTSLTNMEIRLNTSLCTWGKQGTGSC